MKIVTTLLCGAFLTMVPAQAELRLPAVISDHAMFQADRPVAIWGWADPGAKVQVAFGAGGAASAGNFIATADTTGQWSGQLPAMKDGTSGQLDVSTDQGERKTVTDILVGEVWLCGGQSNMEYDVQGTGRVNTKDPAEVAEVAQNVIIAQKEADAAQPPIRYFRVAALRANQPRDDVKGVWVLGSSKNVARFSAVAWNFAVALQNRLHAPIGLIVSCVGNTPVETWMSRETLLGTSVGAGVIARSQVERAAVTPDKMAKYQAALAAWKAANPTPALQSQNRKDRPPAPPNLSAENYVPDQYYNGMIRGLEPYTLRGFIWYQGAGNMAHPFEYGEMFQAMIKEWRAEWKDDRLPFYFGEEINFQAKQTRPVEPNGVSLIREQQHAALALPGVGMVCTMDLGNGNGHYPKKKPVGERMAGLALRDCYNQPGPVDGPLYQGFSIEGNKVRLKFSHAEGLRVRGGGGLKGFAIRGSTGDWVWATGEIDGQDIVVWSDQVPTPAAVRYAWAINPVTSVENGAGLPLYAFRTDTESQE